MNWRIEGAILLSAALAVGASAQIASHKMLVPDTVSVNPQGPIVSGKPVARVNGVVLTDRDLLREEYAIFPYAKQHGGKIPRDMEPEIRNGALQMIIFDELAYQAALKRGLLVSPVRLRRAEEEFRKQFSNADDYKHFLATEFQGSEKILRDQIKHALLIEQFLKSEVDNKAAISPAELKAYYEKNPASFRYRESFAIQTISVIPSANASSSQLKEARQRAENAFAQAKATKTAREFGLLAEKISEDDYRVMLGDHGWIERSNMPPQMLEPALKMQPGQISEVIQVGQNYVVFRMNRHIPAGILSFEQVKDKLRADLQKRKTNDVRMALDKKLRQNAKIETL